MEFTLEMEKDESEQKFILYLDMVQNSIAIDICMKPAF